jgi:NAD(P)-dependent dehydrogenase (short-subunit alcohol dehydrogenase family)
VVSSPDRGNARASRASRGAVVLIAGCANDVGMALVSRIASADCVVAVIDDDAEGVERASRTVSERGGRFISLACRLDDVAALDRVSGSWPADVDRVDTLVNCQFAIERANTLDTDLAAWDRVLRANLVGPLALARTLLPLLRRSASPSIVNVGSIDGLQGNPNVASYSAAKGGLVALTHVMAHDFGRHGVRVNYVARCATAPDDLDRLDSRRARFAERAARLTPLGRLGDAAETASVIEFLASPAASFVNGAVLTVDGGRSAVTPGTSDPAGAASR